MVLNVCLAGATGWAGSELARSIARTADLALVAAVARKHAGRVLGDVLGEPRLTGHIYASAAEALANPCDVFVEYTKPDSARTNILTALEHGAHVVVGTSGLTESDFAQIDVLARKQHRGVLACGNFALTVVLLQKFAEAAARLIPQWEIIDYAHDDKVDAPSGTARELAFRLSKVRNPEPTVPLDEDRRPSRDPRRHRFRLSGAFRSSARLRDRRRDHLRDAGSKADDPSRLGEQRTSVRGRGSARHSEGLYARWRPSRSGLRARSLSKGDIARVATMMPNPSF